MYAAYAFLEHGTGQAPIRPCRLKGILHTPDRNRLGINRHFTLT